MSQRVVLFQTFLFSNIIGFSREIHCRIRKFSNEKRSVQFWVKSFWSRSEKVFERCLKTFYESNLFASWARRENFDHPDDKERKWLRKRARKWARKKEREQQMKLGSGCGSVGRAVASKTSHRQNLYWTFVYLFIINCIEKTEAGNGPLIKKQIILVVREIQIMYDNKCGGY